MLGFVRRFDLGVFFCYVLLNGVTYTLGYHFLLEHDDKHPIVARIHALIIIYGSAQSFFGFAAGYCVGVFRHHMVCCRAGGDQYAAASVEDEEEDTASYSDVI